MNTFEKHAYKAAGIAGIISNLIVLFVSPFYESGIFIYVTPLISLGLITFFVFYLRNSPAAYKISLYYALSSIVIVGGFLGQSNDAYGQYAQIMYIREIFDIGVGVALLIIYFLPGVRLFYKRTT